MKKIALEINGKKVPLNNFVKAFISSALKGMVSALRGGGKPKKIRLEIEY